MEFKPDSVDALYLAGKPQVAIVRALQYINVKKAFVLAAQPDVKEVDEIKQQHQQKWFEN